MPGRRTNYSAEGGGGSDEYEYSVSSRICEVERMGQGAWRRAYTDAMHRSRTPCIILIMVVASHLACCSQVWGGWFSQPEQPPILQSDPAAPEASPEVSSWWWALVLKDPLTNVFDAFSPQDPVIVEAAPPTADCKNPTPTPRPTAAPELSEAAAVMGVAGFSFLILWIPSTHAAPIHKWEGAWALGSGAVVCLTAAAASLVALGRLGIPSRAIMCSSMHLSAQHILATWCVCSSDCGGSPLTCLGRSCSQIVCAFSLAFLLFHLSHHLPGEGVANYDSSQFWSSHAWGLVLAEAIRSAVYFPVLSVFLSDQ